MELSHQSSSDQVTTYRRPAELLQNLIRFNTTNPPGKEAECINYIDNLLTATGFKTSILARDSARPNLVTRLSGEGKAAPLLLYGPVDVVTTERETWQHPQESISIRELYEEHLSDTHLTPISSLHTQA